MKTIPLTKELVEQYADEITKSLDGIPETDPHTKEKLLQEAKGDRILHHKWDHSFILLEDKEFVGIAIGYERDAEGNDQYPYNSIYLGDFAITSEHQRKGLGKVLLKDWLEHNTKLGFLVVDGDLKFSLQTHSADWNKHVQKFYENFGFKQTATKDYGHKIDYIYYLNL